MSRSAGIGGNHIASWMVGLALVVATAGNGRAAELRQAAGETVYVPVYSNVYSGDRALPFNLAATLSIRNTSTGESITLLGADYYDSAGRLLRRYVVTPVVLGPLASTKVFIPEKDSSGGFGASFIVRWRAAKKVSAPVIECVMIGARSGQGISFVSPGQVIGSGGR